MSAIDNEPMLLAAMRVTETADWVVEKLDRDIVRDTPEKEQTYEIIKTTIETQSHCIRRLVEQHASIADKVNEAFAKYNLE